MSSKRNASMIIGISMDQEICPILGQVSPSSLYWVWNFQMHGLGGDRQNGKRHPGQIREQHKRAIEKPKLDNARRLRGIYLIDPEDKEFKETTGNAGKKLETPVDKDMLCKISKNNQHGATRGIKSKFLCILEASESTRLRIEESLPNYHEDHIAGRGNNSLQHYNLVHKYSYASSHENSRSKGSGGQGMWKIGEISAWNLAKVKSKKQVIDTWHELDDLIFYGQ